MIYFDFECVTIANVREHIPNWLQIDDHPYRILAI